MKIIYAKPKDKPSAQFRPYGVEIDVHLLGRIRHAHAPCPLLITVSKESGGHVTMTPFSLPRIKGNAMEPNGADIPIDQQMRSILVRELCQIKNVNAFKPSVVAAWDLMVKKFGHDLTALDVPQDIFKVLLRSLEDQVGVTLGKASPLGYWTDLNLSDEKPSAHLRLVERNGRHWKDISDFSFPDVFPFGNHLVIPLPTSYLTMFHVRGNPTKEALIVLVSHLLQDLVKRESRDIPAHIKDDPDWVKFWARADVRGKTLTMGDMHTALRKVAEYLVSFQMIVRQDGVSW